ncbi:PD-(D/E)XK nuclease family protein [Salinibacterium sp. SYSU T00001]|uniref:UrvD/REP family ATP-dependent DNA helicase n=1 Tax=Homoserinimonas sedimenticola TaxID=2986805 RepID=UPI002235C7C2|nr:UrvD/REP family ATP-dependent DNA helicase [Salinibacterium sedimenticola]MCW4386522.1 PD-(D/E)XK nuclease family protein [Salinibacterium sedimenticola]
MRDEGERMLQAPGAVALDPAQRAVLDLPVGASAAVIGAPGTGKTTTLVELVADRILRLGWASDEVLVLTSSRVSATRLRDRLALRLGRPTTGPLARTVNSLAFDIVGAAARVDDRPQPTLVTGGEQDSDIAGLLEGHLEDGTGPAWPEHLSGEVRRARGFRTELRDLLMRATEYGIAPERLRSLGKEHGREEWVAAADFIAEYRDVLGLQRPHQLDSTELVEQAVLELRRGRPGDIAAPLRLVIVDDAQEATRSTLALLAALAERGTAVVAFGNPDTAANAFRGGEVDALGRLSQVLGVETTRVELRTIHRHGALLSGLVASVAANIGTAGSTGQRGATSTVDAAGEVTVVAAPSPSRERSAVARRLRERHLVDGVAWGEMAVVARSGAQVPALARALALAEVPTRTTLAARPLREDGAARSLLALVDVGMGRSPLTAEAATELLLGPFGGLDRLDLRRLRLALRAEELAGGGERGADALIVEALEAPGRLVTIDHRSGRRAERLAGTLAAIADAHRGDATIEELLWLAWERSGLHRTWYQEAIGSGIAAAEANRNLDGIVALFSAAKRFVEREPGAPARVFLDDVLDADVPEDTLSPQSRGDAVLVTTPSGVVGLEFDTVAVAGVQEGVWPNLRIRGTLLGAQDLVRAVTGEDAHLDERRVVRDDELRMFALAVSRARNEVIVSATANDDEAPSVLFSLLPEGARHLDATSPVPLSLRGVTGRLRHELTRHDSPAPARDAAAAALAHLAEEGVPGADPTQWQGLVDLSTTEPLYSDDEQVPVSPSRMSAFEESPLDWFIDSICGSAPSAAMSIGTIVHWAMETSEDESVDGIWQAIESRWGELVFEAPWLAEKERAATRLLAAAVAEYLGDFSRDGKKLVGAESRFELDVDRARVRGSIDRVEIDADGGVVIVDLKTGRPETKQTVIDEHPQLAAYQLAYAEGLLDDALSMHGEHRAGGAKLLYVKEGVRGKAYREGVQAPLTPEQLNEFRGRIALAARGMAAAEFSGSREIDDRRPGSAARRLHRVRAVTHD